MRQGKLSGHLSDPPQGQTGKTCFTRHGTAARVRQVVVVMVPLSPFAQERPAPLLGYRGCGTRETKQGSPNRGGKTPVRRWGGQDSPPFRPGNHLWTGAPVGGLGRNGPRPWPRTWAGAPVEALWGVTAPAHCRQMQSRSLAGPVCIWTGLLTCSQDIRSVVRLTSPVCVGPGVQLPTP